MVTKGYAKPGSGFTQVSAESLKSHNWTDIGNGVKICRECGAEVEQKKNYQLYTPGNGDCD